MTGIPTWRERAEAHPGHQTGMVSEGMIEARMCEEIADLRAEVKQLIRKRDEALEEIRCLGGSEVLSRHSGSSGREWHSVGAYLYPGETINHVIRSPREHLETKS